MPSLQRLMDASRISLLEDAKLKTKGTSGGGK
jgi:hypothetical protein